MTEHTVQPLISVIIPVFNAEEYLPACMESFFRQTYNHLEIILVDDGSGKICADLCDTYAEKDPRVTVIHQENTGISDARNAGVRRASGEYITWADADDTADADYVAYLYQLISEKETDMAVCQHRVAFPDHTVDYGSERDCEVLSAADCIERMLYHDVIDTSVWGKLYRRTLYENISYPSGRLFEDIAVTYQLMIKSGRIAVGYESKYNYFRHEDSIVTGRYTPAKLDLLEMTDQMGAGVLNYDPDLKDAVICRRVYARFSTLNQMIDTKDTETERKEIIGFIKKHSREILSSPKVSQREKGAVILIRMGYPVYRCIYRIFYR